MAVFLFRVISDVFLGLAGGVSDFWCGHALAPYDDPGSVLALRTGCVWSGVKGVQGVQSGRKSSPCPQL